MPSESEHLEVAVGVGSWCVCSVGMMVFNKLAIQAFPLECSLVALQMAFCVLVMLVCCWRSLHIGSLRDVLRWSMVAPLFTGMLLTSILALKNAPMTLVVTFRVLSPLLSLAAERFYPSPLRISSGMVAAVAFMVMGTCLYASQMARTEIKSVQWVVLNILFGVGDRLLQRLMLAKDQHPVDISKTGVTLLNNLLGLAPILMAAWWKGELAQVSAAAAGLSHLGVCWVVASCVVGVGISYCGIWAQSLITATSFLVLVNANKFAIIFLEVLFMRTKVLHPVQMVGAFITILAGVAYGRAREQIEEEQAKEDLKGKAGEEPADAEAQPLLAKHA